MEQIQQPMKRRKEQRPGEIIAAGLAEFAEKGFAAARLEDVAKRAGIAKGTIYRYFDDKETLFMAAVESMATPAFADLEGFFENSDLPTRELMKALLMKAHDLLTKSHLPILMHIIISEGRNFPQLPQFYYQQGVSRGRRLMDLLVRRGIERGELMDNAATRLPIVLVAPAIMAAVWGMTFNKFDEISAKAFMEAHIDLVFDGIWIDKP
jgi:AcrR family transcriptional regulator